MADNVNVSGSVESDGRHRVAYDLMVRISNIESKASIEKDRKYYLTLYSQCLQVASRVDVESVSPDIK